MKISIITVCRNAESTISDTIRSVSSQAGVDYEHIIIDGNSSDDTMRIVDRLSHEKLNVLSEPDGGLYDAMNKGIRRAKGDIVGFLNADDFYCRRDALLILRELLQDAQAHAASASVAIVDPVHTNRLQRAYDASDFRPWMMRFGHMPPHPGFYVRKSSIEQVGEFDTTLKIGADFEWMVRFYLVHGLKAKATETSVIAMRSGGVSQRGLESLLAINRESLMSLRRHGIGVSLPHMIGKYLIKAPQLLRRAISFPPPPEIRWSPQGKADQ